MSDLRHLCSIQFIVSGGSSPIPAICGTNSGQHSNVFWSKKIMLFVVKISLKFHRTKKNENAMLLVCIKAFRSVSYILEI